jgi:hypothetical protein
MYVLRLYATEISLPVNISYSVSEVFLLLNTPKSTTEEYLQYKCAYSLTYTNINYDGFTWFMTTVVLLGTKFSGPREGRNLGVEVVNLRG